jgi:hypothetical protein
VSGRIVCVSHKGRVGDVDARRTSNAQDSGDGERYRPDNFDGRSPTRPPFRQGIRETALSMMAAVAEA